VSDWRKWWQDSKTSLSVVRRLMFLEKLLRGNSCAHGKMEKMVSSVAKRESQSERATYDDGTGKVTRLARLGQVTR